MEYPWILLVIFIFGTAVGTPNPCTTYQNISDTAFQTSSACFPQSPAPTWYRFTGNSAGSMATQCPTASECGGAEHVWINGLLPTYNDDTTDVRMCISKGSKCCPVENKLRAKNCNSFFVFELRRLPNCNVQYCFNKTDVTLVTVSTTPSTTSSTTLSTTSSTTTRSTTSSTTPSTSSTTLSTTSSTTTRSTTSSTTPSTSSTTLSTTSSTTTRSTTSLMTPTTSRTPTTSSSTTRYTTPTTTTLPTISLATGPSTIPLSTTPLARITSLIINTAKRTNQPTSTQASISKAFAISKVITKSTALYGALSTGDPNTLTISPKLRNDTMKKEPNRSSTTTVIAVCTSIGVLILIGIIFVLVFRIYRSKLRHLILDDNQIQPLREERSRNVKFNSANLQCRNDSAMQNTS